MDLHTPPSAHTRRQLLALRACLIFFGAWFVQDLAFSEYLHFTLLLAGLFAAASLVPRDSEAGLSAVIWLSGAPLALVVVELLNNTDPLASLSVLQCLLNLSWYYLLFGVLLLMLGRIRRSAALAMVLCFGIGLANHYVLDFRGRIIFPSDLTTIGTAFDVAAGYDYTPNRTIVRAALFAAAYLLLLSRLPAQAKPHRPRPQWVAGFSAAVVLYCGIFFGTGLLPALGIYAQQWKTQANGFVLNFAAALRYSMVTTPEGYSRTAIRQIIDNAPAAEAPAGTRPVHIIGIMNESFSDLAVYEDLCLSEDPAPFLHSLRENTIKGTLYSPVTGGGTANVEFEFLTGNSLAFLPPNTVAYQLYLRDNTPSLVSQLAALGYKSAAFHPYRSSGWNRTSVYDWMGFDAQLYEPDVPDAEKIRGFVSDKSNYEKVVELTEAAGDDPFFLFNVTMQNHSGYTMPWTGLERTSTLSGELENGFPAADQFFSLVRESDDALRELIAHYKASDVPTMIVFFGDHQPPLGNEFYEELVGKPLDDRTTAEVLDQHTTPFFIWANYDIPEAEGLELSAWGLHLLAAQTANLPLTGYQQFLSEVSQTLPIITPVGICTADGRYAAEDEAGLTSRERRLLQEYRLLAYNNIFGKSDRANDFFFPQ